MNLSPDIACRQCQLQAGFDPDCLDCCMRMLRMFHTETVQKSFLDYIERITDPAHAKRVRDAWKNYVDGGGKS